MTMIKNGVLTIDLLCPANGLQIQSEYEPINKQWFRLDSEWITHVRTNTSKNTKLKTIDDIKTDPWGRPLIPWTYAYAQPGEENLGPQEWKMDYDNTRATHRFYRYVTINGKYIKLKLIFKHE